MARLPSSGPMKAKFSGRRTSWAPRSAASATRRVTAAKLASTSSWLDIWAAATVSFAGFFIVA
jgi:hypothetical protein